MQNNNPAKTIPSRKSSLKSTIMDQSGAGKVKIGEILCKEGYITGTQLEDALNYQKKNKGRLGNILIKLGYIEDDTIVSVLSRIHNYPAVLLSKTTPDPEAIKLVPYEMAKKYLAFPIRFKGEDLVVTMAEPTDTSAVADLQNEVQKSISISISTEKDIIEAYRTHYKIEDEEYNSLLGQKEVVSEEEDEPVALVDDFGSLVSEAVGELELVDTGSIDVADEYTASDAPIIKLVNGILVKAINEGVSDIHIEPFETMLQVRYRLDGYLFKSMNLPTTIKNAVNSRLKILAGLNIAERRVPQDGRIKMNFGKRKTIDFRVSTLPTLFGESIVMRVLDQSSLSVDLTRMGFEKETLNTLERCIFRPYGMLLVTGPTGSGKTTTLYSVLNKLNREDNKILTVEDPVEFNFRGINQVNVKDDVGMTFASALKAFLRQDPDIIMVGEIRDLETAEIAIKAAMTGHLVFSTLHTNDCPSTVGRLLDIGIPSYLVASSLTMVLSQRLARKLCPKCKVKDKNFNPAELEDMGFSSDEISKLEIYGPGGCSECMGAGYRGRVGLFELMEVTDRISRIISAQVSEDQLRKTALLEGMVTLRDAGLEKIRQGVTSVEEILKRTTVTKSAVPAYLADPEVEQYENKAVIFREGNRGSDFFKLIKGELVVVRNGKKIADIMQPGEYFGEISAITGKPRSETVMSRGNSVVQRFPGDKLPEIIEKYPDITTKLLEINADRLNHAHNIIVNIMNKKMP
ncbi:MAG: type IV-A pilus assembly ATPase PilB [Deltaproteobacteria bacterium]|nr:type IV-A pilus assembly ATPase PilB [Deltaproteobacteria bacterium]MBW1957100.1 type IV-A pilus assembly ATPase PilB [Deltaproteobacteria bacterium]MBW2012485.1 type IV-A pilus assembly ATPase PilB [Deltaproteobacteria bacterium]MBW2088424.1 type IV-A pilus assembly ATPase PilB [Deltaproteobacteria bacterium]MBW2319703.1 type IV-A pilus assembly ATPase PilB [Deltaproteobacteria bacterium]